MDSFTLAPRAIENKGNDQQDSLLEDFEVVHRFNEVNGVPKQAPSVGDLVLEIHPLKEVDSILILLHPPKQPETDIKHVPCDIVLVIDVSGSMADEAALPDVQDSDQKESSGLSILDLTKHAAKTVLESLNEGDRFGLVTFSYDAKIIQPLTIMSEAAKKETVERIENLVEEGATNLWAGIETGLTLFETATAMENVQGLYVLTDGMPNHMNPRKGFATAIEPVLRERVSRQLSIPTIHTFGFGYSIRSNLLQSIAEVGNGSYAFIPDAGMIGTIFVHAVANLQSTCFSATTLELKTSQSEAILSSVSGIPADASSPNQLILRLGTIQYGQSRDTVVSYSGVQPATDVTAVLTYTLPNGVTRSLTQTVNLSEKTRLSTSITRYHIHRTELCAFLSSLFPSQDNGGHVKPRPLPTDVQDQMTKLVTSIKSTVVSQPSDANILSLLHDLIGPGPDEDDGDDTSSGQIHQALTETPEKSYWKRWGVHYLPSLLHAHMRQSCNSFKDPGPLRYGIESPLFIHCRDEMDLLFSKLPPPKPSVAIRRGNKSHVPVSMSRFHSSSNPCFLGGCEIKLKNMKSIRVKDLRIGMKVWSPLIGEERSIASIMKTETKEAGNMIYQINHDLWITGYHPILRGNQWVFPREVAENARELVPNEAVYSILLKPSDDNNSHAVSIDGVTCVTLGHGLVTNDEAVTEDIRVHSFFGDYVRVSDTLSRLPLNQDGHRLCAGLTRDVDTGLACGLVPAAAAEEVSQADTKMMASWIHSVTVVKPEESVAVLVTA